MKPGTMSILSMEDTRAKLDADRQQKIDDGTATVATTLGYYTLAQTLAFARRSLVHVHGEPDDISRARWAKLSPEEKREMMEKAKREAVGR